jgi:hypothetical protein
MAESKQNTVTFEGVTFIASRPEVLPLLTLAAATKNNRMFVAFRGTEAELIGAGLATAETFQVGKSGQMRRDNGFGDHITVIRRRHSWILQMLLSDHGKCGVPCDDPVENRRTAQWWAKWGAAAEAATVDILKRFARTVRP